MIRFSCRCGRMLQAKETMIGQLALCPVCDSEQVVPAQDESAPPTARPSEEAEASSESSRKKARSGRWSSRDEDDSLPRALDEDRPRLRTRSGPPTSGKAMGALILGIFSFVALLLTGIPAMLLGYLAMRDVKRANGKLVGWGMGLSGLILGGLGVFVLTPLIACTVIWPIYSFLVENSLKKPVSADLQQIGIALHKYLSTNQRFPGAAIRGPDGKALLSWRVALLPSLGEDALYQQFHLNEPWDSPHNQRLALKMPKVFAHPLDQPANQSGKTHYQVCVGPGTVFERPEGHGLFEITDGTSQTALVLEANRAVVWTSPEDLLFDPQGLPPDLGGLFRDGFHVLLCDGSVRFVHNSVGAHAKRCLIQRNDGMFFWLP